MLGLFNKSKETNANSDQTCAGEAPKRSRETLERTRDLLLSTLTHETDRQKINAGIEKIADINASLRRCDDLDEARIQVLNVQRQKNSVDPSAVQKARYEYLHNLGIIGTAVLMKDAGYRERFNDNDPPSALNKRMSTEYMNLLMAAELSFEETLSQVDEILSAKIQKREWEDFVKLPKVPDSRGRK